MLIAASFGPVLDQNDHQSFLNDCSVRVRSIHLIFVHPAKNSSVSCKYRWESCRTTHYISCFSCFQAHPFFIRDFHFFVARAREHETACPGGKGIIAPLPKLSCTTGTQRIDTQLLINFQSRALFHLDNFYKINKHLRPSPLVPSGVSLLPPTTSEFDDWYLRS